MMKIKTNQLTGAALDWAVAICEGFTDYDHATETMLPPRKEYGRVNMYEYSYSTDWAEGGPIIEREKVCVEYMAGAGDGGLDVWVTEVLHEDRKYSGVTSSAGEGPTPLIAAMRCYVASKLGDYIDIPEELTP